MDDLSTTPTRTRSKRARASQRGATGDATTAAATTAGKRAKKRKRNAKPTATPVEQAAAASPVNPAPPTEAEVAMETPSATTTDEAKAAPARAPAGNSRKWLRTGLGVAAGLLTAGALFRKR